MGEQLASARENMIVDYHMFFLAEDGIRPGRFEYHNPLVAVEPGCAAIRTGIAQGYVDLTVETCSKAPPLDLAEWETVVEVTLEAPRGRIVVTAVMDDAPAFPVLTPGGTGTYRARVHARGRDNAVDSVAFTPVEHYLIQVWPAPAATQITHKNTDTYGRL
ncbi:hypothetical protein AB0H37_42840 [Actinomadura sp. NPDC023710]|uniref:hypothetical protein n=1 Tax=Actinomadura sp. NPDC023710 TaxID=3158219 RepID=UPI0033C32AEB